MYTASSWRRIIAYVIDQIIVGFLYIPVWIQVVDSWITSEAIQIEWKWLLVCFGFQFLYKWIFLSLLGATVGKLLLGLQLVSVNTNKRANWVQCLLRIFADHLSLFFGMGPRALALMRFDRRHLSDWVAETQVKQLFPRMTHPKRRLILSLILFIYFSISGLLTASELIQRLEWDSNRLIIYPQDTEYSQAVDLDTEI